MADLNDTPRASRTHIAFFGRTNAGKSSLVNAFLGQEVALTSDIAGTTTDPVYKSMELLPLGPVVLIDTAGLGDTTPLGQKRMQKTKEVADKTDIAVMVVASNARDLSAEREFAAFLQAKKIPVVWAVNSFDEQKPLADAVYVHAKTRAGVEALRARIADFADSAAEIGLTEGLVCAGDRVVLVMPQDIQAPKGRLILPQVQMIRDLLDRDCRVYCIKTGDLSDFLGDLSAPPDLVITDSQIFKTVDEKLPREIPLTSFSVLMSRQKGDVEAFARGAQAIGHLKPGDPVLSLEACTHHALDGDIAREKLPRLLEKTVGGAVDFHVHSGHEMPRGLEKYKLAITCGGCMINRKNMLSRIAACEAAGVPITNFGIAIAYMNGILGRICY